jgi:hypothetical protein
VLVLRFDPGTIDHEQSGWLASVGLRHAVHRFEPGADAACTCPNKIPRLPEVNAKSVIIASINGT